MSSISKNTIVSGLCVLILVLQVSAILTNHWSMKKVSNGSQIAGESVKAEMGLWKVCMEVSGPISDKQCIDMLPNNDPAFPKNSLYACRALSIIGAVLILCALGCLTMAKGQHKKCMLACLAVGGLMSVLASIVWSAELLNIKKADNTTLKTKPCISWYANLFGGLIALCMAGYLYQQ